MKRNVSIPFFGALVACATGTAAAQTAPAPADPPAAEAPAVEETAQDALPVEPAAPPPPSTDILSGRTLSILLDGRLVAANGQQRFSTSRVGRTLVPENGFDGQRRPSTGGLGITRFDGTSDGDFRVNPLPIEADLIWTPRFTNTLSANVSGGWQRDQSNEVDLYEAFVTFLPERSGGISFSAKAGLYWPEISLEHATGGAWSTVHTITPSAINSWVGEEVKFIGAEVSMIASVGTSDIVATAGVFGLNDTAGTLLSFRGWALHDIKATAFGYFDLPPFNKFVGGFQEGRTRSLIDIDKRVGFYGRLEWRPAVPVTVNAFYYDNRGDPQTFTLAGQWGWRTRFGNLGVAAELAPGTRLLAQTMIGTTQMGFKTRDVVWIDTFYRSAFVLVAHDVGDGQISGRIETFETKERGSELVRADESQDGWAATAAGRYSFGPIFTGFVELLHVRSTRGTRRTYFGLPPTESQTVIQASLRVRL